MRPQNRERPLTNPDTDPSPTRSAAPAPAERVIVLATRNAGKLREIRQVLGDLPVRVVGIEELGDMPEPAEDGATFAENARAKALYYARQTGRWCLADDSGLAVDALDGAPGVHSARYAAEQFRPDADRATRDAVNVAKLLTALADVPAPARTARFVCHLALAGDGNILIETSGMLAGAIARAPRGCNGFGYDPVFLVPQAGHTAAEMSADEKNAVSHRGRAVRDLSRLLRDFLARAGT